MDEPLTYDIENKTRRRFVTEANWIPGFWNFLLGLDCDDLIAELVQNDLDQGATCTDISFEQDRLVCEGNGEPVDSEGWLRLRKIQGAGNSVPAKRGKIGIKNHGLKTAFTIGDEIRLLSDGQAITQTLYARGRDTAPYPGASPEPEADPQAPVKGCRVIIRYRNADIAPLEGEAVVFRAVDAQAIDALFKSACASTPEQFAGIVSPRVVPRYQIVLRHGHLGEARFVFSCTRPRNLARPTKGIEIFRRRCAVSGTVHSLPADLKEEAVRRLLPLKGSLRQRVADFFRLENRFFVEVSWPVDGRGKPGTGAGRFRYPIGYPEGSHDARTGHSAFFNAPIVSDTERHGPARNEATNKELREACEMLLVDALARHAIPRWGPDGLNPLVPSPESNNEDEAVRPLLAKLARRGAMPTLTWRTVARRVLKSKRRKASASERHAAVQQRSGEPRRYRFVMPAASWNPEVIDASLSVICPRSERQLDPRVHPDIVRLLTDKHTDGFYEDFITFDENDTLSRSIGEGNQYFTACDKPEQEFAQPLIAHFYLDMIQEALENKCAAATGNELQAALLLPDTHAEATRFRTLHASASLPSDVPGLSLPPILHQDLASHPLFRRPKWRIPKYTMAKFLESRALQDADEQTRKLCWQWLRQNERRIATRDRAKLADIAIWPDIDGNICKLSDLCDPRSRRVATILRNSIRRPHEYVRRSRIVTSSKKRRTFIRHIPSQDEISNWLGRRMAPFVPGDMPNVDTVAALDRFEADLTTLLKNSGVARVLRAIGIALPALAQDGSIRQRTELIMPSSNNERLALRKRFLLKDTRRATALNKISQTLSDPTIAMLLSTFDKDRENFEALQARLHQFLALTEPSDSHRVQLAVMPILPHHGQPHAPQDLAFKDQRGDYWGDWKIQIYGKGLSQDDQQRYRYVGVTSASPTCETSRDFFEWLSRQDAAVLEQHVNCVLRHILHRDGPENWAESFIDTPFIPAESSGGLRLVSLRQARRRPVYLPDAEIAEAVIKNDSRIALVIVKVREVLEPISEPLRKLGVRALREAIGEPEHVGGSGNIEQATKDVLNGFATLRSPMFRRTFRKRLDELGVESELVRRDWHDRLSRIGKIRFADIVEARYRFWRKPYCVAVDAGFDPVSGTFWIKQGHRVRLSSSLYKAIAAQLVFKPTARLIHLSALELALELEIHDPSFKRPASAVSSSENEEGTLNEDSRDGESEAEDEDDDPGEAMSGHSPFKPDASRNVPKARPIPSTASPASHHHERWRSNEHGSSKGSRGNKPAPKLEKDHIEALKRDQYASHCQMCLCERPPQELAPVGSYIEWEEVRRRVVEAHHVDLKSAGGARHAGNLILLCKLHHDNYGRRLTRVAVTAALRDKKKDKVVRFGENNDGDTERKGQAVEILLPDTGESVAIFFTNEHADWWLSSAL